jgi:hypothetical protein
MWVTTLTSRGKAAILLMTFPMSLCSVSLFILPLYPSNVTSTLPLEFNFTAYFTETNLYAALN